MKNLEKNIYGNMMYNFDSDKKPKKPKKTKKHNVFNDKTQKNIYGNMMYNFDK